ncbi:chemotaxis protein histidine kinase-like protein [Leptolyngbya sp. Heron Island J]|uniref:hybrid sensor histidine kinase/response regulator n=1 Tax=Leptolyngbya sp. Heron Island J TaxID=1385935 RepID=UPI0003B97D91|nr:response regulator [Leptolyngbya sp. Heron Island J]ESA35453.1 chemotaxis protein histidine kinase-like protein [Leptolyngbya sp. Heron Island J]
MTIDPDIRDQAYHFFIEEASELLDIIETGLLNLRPDVSVQKVHEIMRAAHSIKGGAASVELNTIKTIAHRLEDSFKALYSDTVVVDSDLETLLLRAYDCLRHPLQSQIDTGTFNEQQTLVACENIFNKLESRLGPALNTTDSFIPSAADLGIDIVASIFEVDVAEVIANLKDILANPQNYNCGQELQSQIEILTGFAELVDIPEFIAIITTAQTAASRHASQPLPVIEQVLCDTDRVRTSVLTGNKNILDGPSEALLALANKEAIGLLAESDTSEIYGQLDDFDLSDLSLDMLEQATYSETEDFALASSDSTTEQISTLEDIWSIEATELPSAEKLENGLSSDLTQSDIEALADVWGNPTSAVTESEVEETDFKTVIADGLPEVRIELEANSTSPNAALSSNHPDYTNAQDTEQVLSFDQEILDRTESAIRLIENVYDSLPELIEEKKPVPDQKQHKKNRNLQTKSKTQSTLSAKVGLARLEHMDNLVGELAINRNSLSLHNHQFQRTVRRLGQRFSSFRAIVKQLQNISDQILISPNQQLSKSTTGSTHTTFDSLEMDSYGEINLLLEGVLEEVFQLAESIDDVALFAGQSNQLLERQRRTLTQLRDELMWSRMVPLDRVLKRFPRIIRELSNTYQKPVQLKLTGTGVLVDRVMLEKLYDPLLHLLRNAFDHGIELPEIRRSLGKSDQGTIEIRAYHQGNHTVIDIEDDGQGIDINKIVQRAIERQLLSSEQIETMPKQRLQQLIFEPGFSTVETVSELSGRGVGLDVVKASLQTFNGKLSLTTNQGQGTLFSLKIPLTLTLTKLVVGSVGTTAIALASDSIEEILRPANHQLKQSGGKRFLHWRSQLIPVYELDKLLSYQYQAPEHLPQELQANRAIKNQQKTMLIIQQGQEMFALSLEQIVTEQELVIKPMGKAIAAPPYINGCTVLADGSLVPVIDGAALVHFDAGPLKPSQPQPHRHAQTLMIVDDSSALRRTLALTLHKAGYQVLQAKDGRDALDQLQRGAIPELIICDVEMPRLNGFEFLSQRRANSVWSQIPTVMLTSRGNQKHRTLAKHLGATDYFTKPYIEKEFVSAIANLLQQHP